MNKRRGGKQRKRPPGLGRTVTGKGERKKGAYHKKGLNSERVLSEASFNGKKRKKKGGGRPDIISVGEEKGGRRVPVLSSRLKKKKEERMDYSEEEEKKRKTSRTDFSESSVQRGGENKIGYYCLSRKKGKEQDLYLKGVLKEKG